MACAKTCVLLCHCCCCCCCKDYTELFYLLTARSVYPYNFCMSYSMCTCPCVSERVLHMARSLVYLSPSLCFPVTLLTEAVQSLRPSRPSVVAVCVLLFCARLHVQISTTISSSMAMKVASCLLLLPRSRSISVSFCCLSRTHHRLFRSVCMQSTEIETCNKWPCLTFCSGRTG